MKTKITVATFVMSFIATFAIAQWQQIGYMVVNTTDTVSGSHMIRGFGTDVYACTTKGIFRSADNGQSWANISYNAAVIQNEDINCVFVAANNDIYAGSTRRLYKSTDNGSSWTWLNTIPDSLGISDVNEMNGNIIVSYRIGFSGGGAYYSNNAGASWTAASGLNNVPKFRLLANAVTSTIFLGGNSAIYKSIDNGQSWSVAGSGFGSGGYYDLVETGGVLFASDIYGNGLYGSYDNANTWANVDTVAFDPFCQVFSEATANNLIIASMDGTPCNPGGISPIKMSADTGHSWTAFMNNLPPNFYSSVGRNAAGTAFFTSEGNGKRVYRYDLVLGLNASELIQPKVSVFPNPLSTTATISVSGELKKYSFIIFNMPGQQVYQTQITNSQTQIDKGNLAPGIYFYQLRDENQVYDCGKIIVQ